jgi:hypothetical protein
LALVLATGPAVAETCRRTADGKARIPRTGTCPSGYFASGGCCEAFRATTPEAFPRGPDRSCPSGTFASGGSCKSFR